MSAAISTTSHAFEDTLLSASTSTLTVASQEEVSHGTASADSMPPEDGPPITVVQAPGDMEDVSGSPLAEVVSVSSSEQEHISNTPGSSDNNDANELYEQDETQAQNHDRQADVVMEGTAEPEERSPQPPPAPAQLRAGGEEGASEHEEETENDPDEDDVVDEDDENDDDDADSEIEWHKEFLSQFEEDTSKPTAEELEEMQKRKADEKSALNDAHWQNQIFTDLDDPAYSILDQVYCTSFTLPGFHGSVKQIAKDRSFYSDPFRVVNHDGNEYDFRLKIYPRGNDGTNMVSVYLECMPLTKAATTPPDLPNGTTDIASGWWEVTAQFGCVMYNPSEPSVHAFQKAHHQFTSINPDFGWTRFTGPWQDLHQRKHLQKCPLLQADQVAFRTHLRIVKDPTRALWYHSATATSDWDSVLKTGYRGLTVLGSPSSHSALVSAMAIWFELAPLRELFDAFERKDPRDDPLSGYQPLLECLKGSLHRRQASRKDVPGKEDARLDGLVATLAWYGATNLSSPFEVWDSLEKLIRQETEKAKASDKAQSVRVDAIFSSIRTIRSNKVPTLPKCDQIEESTASNVSVLESEPELASVQDLVHRLGDKHEAEVLQIELPRQAYDSQARKWKKLTTNKIALNDVIFMGDSGYRLVGIVTHHGELGSGRYQPILQPRGPGTPWLRWSTRGSSRGSVVAQTHRQAITSHEGHENGDSTSSVASIVVYVRLEALNHYLPTVKDREPHDVFNPLPKLPSIDLSERTERSLCVAIHLSDGFLEHRSPVGYLDPCKAKDDKTLLVHVDPDDTLFDLHDKISQCNGFEDKEFYLLPLDLTEDTRQYLPPMMDLKLEITVISLLSPSNGIHLWLHELSGEQAEVSKRQYEELRKKRAADALAVLKQGTGAHSKNEASKAPANLNNSTRDEQHGSPGEDVVMGGTQELPTGPPPPPITETAHSPPPPATTNGAPTLLPPPPSHASFPPPTLREWDSYTENLASQPGGTEMVISDDDIRIYRRGNNGERVLLNSRLAATPPPPPPPSTMQEPSGHIYVLVKHYYHIKPNPDVRSKSRWIATVEPGGSMLVPQSAAIKDYVKRPTGPGASGAIKYYRERASGSPQAIDGNQTFSAAKIGHGTIIITEPTLHSSNVKQLLLKGIPMNLLDFYAPRNPIRSGELGGGWSSFPLHYGQPHGAGMMMYPNGDAYSGSMIGGRRWGNGTMYYASGSTYQGDWGANEPEGKGVLVHARSGNKYVGPFSRGKQTGEGGVTYWKDAAAGEKLCRICYTEERNTAFVRCGHMVACLSCAKTLIATASRERDRGAGGKPTECPVCRKEIDSILRVYDTLE